MKKQAKIAWLVTLALLAPPIAAMGPVSWADAEEGLEEVYSVSGNDTVSGGDSGAGTGTEKVKLDTPTNLWWGATEDYNAPNSKYWMNWEGVNPSIDESFTYYVASCWDIEVYKDDQFFWNTMYLAPFYESYWDSDAQKTVYTDEPNSKHYIGLADQILDSGSYKFRVRAFAQYDDEAYQHSEWSQWSSITYVRPERELGVVTGVFWDAEKAGVCHFIPLEKSEYLSNYCVALYKQFGDDWYRVSRWWSNTYNYEDGAVADVDFSDVISREGEGKYCVTVQASSNDIDTVANGRESEKSAILDTSVNADKLSGILSGAADKTAVETKTLLTDSADISAIQQAMQTDDAFRGQVQELEGRYALEQNIAVESPVISDTAREYVNPAQVSVVGAAFNAAQGQAVGLQMDVTPEAERVPVYSGYKKNVQLDIRLVSDNTEVHDLSMPVSVTMPIPQGINAAQLIILHHHADGTTEQAAFHVNNDGTITFTVTSFSTFVFAEKDSADTPDEPTPDEPTPDQPVPENPTPGGTAPVNPTPSPDPVPGQSNGGASSWLEPLSSQIAAAAAGSTVRVTKKQGINTLSNDVMQMLVKRGDIALEMEYTYQGTDYHVLIPAGKAMDNDIPWYGPLYLAAHFSIAETAAVTEADHADTVVVQKGDTLGKIARRYHTTISRLAAANPQIKNVNRILPGQIIRIN